MNEKEPNVKRSKLCKVALDFVTIGADIVLFICAMKETRLNVRLIFCAILAANVSVVCKATIRDVKNKLAKNNNIDKIDKL